MTLYQRNFKKIRVVDKNLFRLNHELSEAECFPDFKYMKILQPQNPANF